MASTSGITKETVAVLGASNNPFRYSYQAAKMLEEQGYRVILISPKMRPEKGKEVFLSPNDVKDSAIKIDTLSVYVRPEILSSLTTQIIELAPRRVIFNPGSQSFELETQLKARGIEVEKACTLVLLSTGQF
jgi:predicted CoA-binding protein